MILQVNHRNNTAMKILPRRPRDKDHEHYVYCEFMFFSIPGVRILYPIGIEKSMIAYHLDRDWLVNFGLNYAAYRHPAISETPYTENNISPLNNYIQINGF